jgi:hypothetical protein
MTPPCSATVARTLAHSATFSSTWRGQKQGYRSDQGRAEICEICYEEIFNVEMYDSEREKIGL